MSARHSVLGGHGDHASRGEILAMVFKLSGSAAFPAAAKEKDYGRTRFSGGFSFWRIDVDRQRNITDGFINLGCCAWKGFRSGTCILCDCVWREETNSDENEYGQYREVFGIGFHFRNEVLRLQAD